MKITVTAILGAFALIQSSTALVIPSTDVNTQVDGQAGLEQSTQRTEDALQQLTTHDQELDNIKHPSIRAVYTISTPQANNPSSWKGEAGAAFAKLDQEQKQAEASLRKVEAQRKQALEQAKKSYQQVNQQNTKMWARASGSASAAAASAIIDQQTMIKENQMLNAQRQRDKLNKKAKDTATVAIRVARGFNA